MPGPFDGLTTVPDAGAIREHSVLNALVIVWIDSRSLVVT
jgi:hypothetical protein